MRRTCPVVLIAGLAASLQIQLQAQDLRLPVKEGSIRFAILGDAGTGGSAQRRVAERLAATHRIYPFEFVLMLGDNLYGSERPRDYASKFERPYKPLLDAGVTFHAALGNHDDPEQRLYEPFNMGGERYYTFKAPRGSVRFYALDSNYMEQEQLDWLRKELPASDSDWKIAFFHHPLYSSGERHGPDERLREQLEPLFVEHGIDVVFTGHEHFYERLKPQKGIHYIISGAAAKLRRGNIGKSDITAKGYDRAYTFMIIEIAGDEMYFQTITDKGITVDSGVIRRRTDQGAASGSPVTRSSELLPHTSLSPKRHSPGQCGPHDIEHLPGRWEHAHRGQGAAINHCLPIDQDLEFAVAPPHHLDFRAQFAAKPRRHPDGVQPRYSIRAVANGNASHLHLQ